MKNATQIPLVDIEGKSKRRKDPLVKRYTLTDEEKVATEAELPDCPFCLREQTRRAPRKVRRGAFGEPLEECLQHMDKGEQGSLL